MSQEGAGRVLRGLVAPSCLVLSVCGVQALSRLLLLPLL